MSKFFSSMLVVICVYTAYAKHLTEQPNFVKGCKSKDTKCLRESTQSLFSQFKTSVQGQGLDVPTIDPLKIDKVEVVQNQVEALNVSIVLTNVEIRGMGDAIIKSAKYDEEKGIYSLHMVVPKISMISDYSMIENVETKLKILSELREVDGEQFFYIKDVKMHYTLTAIKTRLENLFNGNKELEESANQFFNDNWKDLNEAFGPVLERTAENMLLIALRKVFLSIPSKFIITDLKGH